MRWIKTTEEVYRAIHVEHHQDFQVFGSFTNMELSPLGSPEIMTEWGFKNATEPLVKYVRKWENGKPMDSGTIDFFIACYDDVKE